MGNYCKGLISPVLKPDGIPSSVELSIYMYHLSWASAKCMLGPVGGVGVGEGRAFLDGGQMSLKKKKKREWGLDFLRGSTTYRNTYQLRIRQSKILCMTQNQGFILFQTAGEAEMLVALGISWMEYKRSI